MSYDRCCCCCSLTVMRIKTTFREFIARWEISSKAYKSKIKSHFVTRLLLSLLAAGCRSHSCCCCCRYLFWKIILKIIKYEKFSSADKFSSDRREIRGESDLGEEILRHSPARMKHLPPNQSTFITLILLWCALTRCCLSLKCGISHAITHKGESRVAINKCTQSERVQWNVVHARS